MVSMPVPLQYWHFPGFVPGKVHHEVCVKVVFFSYLAHTLNHCISNMYQRHSHQCWNLGKLWIGSTLELIEYLLFIHSSGSLSKVQSHYDLLRASIAISRFREIVEPARVEARITKYFSKQFFWINS